MRLRISPTCVFVIASLCLAPILGAQMSMHASAYATRAQLETMASQRATHASDPRLNDADRAQASEDARQLRERLTQGDFRVGDRIVVRITGGASAFDTLSVSSMRSIKVADAGDISLDGVLRSEVEERLNTQLARYFRDVKVRAQPLTRLAVLGEVRAPGFVQVPSQSLLSDAISAAGGPTTTGRLDRISVRRGGATIVAPAAFANGLAAGATLDDLGIRAGDEIVVGAKRPFNWSQVLQTTAVVVGSAATIIAIQNR